MTSEHPFKSTALRYGFILTLGLIALFFIMQLSELTNMLAFRLLDVILIYVVVGFSLRHYQHTTTDGHSYLRNLGLGAATSFFGMLFFALFMVLYLTQLNPGYMEYLKESVPMGPHLNPYIVSVLLLVTGVGAGMLSGYIHALKIKNPDF